MSVPDQMLDDDILFAGNVLRKSPEDDLELRQIGWKEHN